MRFFKFNNYGDYGDFMEKNKVKGLRSTIIFIPTIIVISVLYIIILISTVYINNITTEMNDDKNKTNDCLDEISKIQAASSLMSETMTTFTYAPLIEMGPSLSVNPALGAYKEELADETKRIDYIVEQLAEYDFDQEDLSNIQKAVNNSKFMLDVETRVLTLFYSIEDIKTADREQKLIETILSMLDKYELTSDELLLDDTDKQDKALELMLTGDFIEKKSELSRVIREVTKSINDKHDKKQKDLIFDTKMARGVLWLSIMLILIANILLFFILIKRLILPISRFARQLKDDEELDTKSCLYEPKLLATEYNELLNKRKEFEHELRMVAEIDSLTGLPNRYCYNEFLKNASLNKDSACIFLFDINNLKFVNDNFGHSQGDELIKKASNCIKDCFLDDEGKNCYRIGGDEFVAILHNIDEAEIKNLLNKFKDLQNKYNVSVAVGYVYSKELSKIGYEKLIMKADNNMYKDKQKYKKEY